MEKQKKCPICFSDIDERAVRCPHCQKPQNKYYRLISHPAVTSAYVLVLFAAMMFTLNTMLSTIYDRDDEAFADHRQSISVFNTSIQFGEEEIYKQGEEISVPTVFVIGYIKNDSSVTWRGAVIEAQFFDKQGQLIDTGQEGNYSLVIPEEDVCTFKISYERMLPEESYHTVSARVVFADDEKARWPW